jgi:hypothetical protein
VCGQRDPVQGWFFPRFGVAQPAACLVLGVSRAEAGAFGYRISPLVHGAR